MDCPLAGEFVYDTNQVLLNYGPFIEIISADIILRLATAQNVGKQLHFEMEKLNTHWKSNNAKRWKPLKNDFNCLPKDIEYFVIVLALAGEILRKKTCLYNDIVNMVAYYYQLKKKKIESIGGLNILLERYRTLED